MADKNQVQTDSEVHLSFVARLAFTDSLTEAKDFKGDKKFKFRCKFLTPKESTASKDILAAVLSVATAAWKDKATKELEILKAENKLCFTNGDIKGYEGYPGNYVLSATNKIQPKYFNGVPERLSPEAAAKLFYSGCYVIAKVGIWAQDNEWGKRINCNLRGVQFYAQGEAFTGGGVAGDDEFEAVPQGDGKPSSNQLSANNASFM